MKRIINGFKLTLAEEKTNSYGEKSSRKRIITREKKGMFEDTCTFIPTHSSEYFVLEIHTMLRMVIVLKCK